MVSNWQVGMDFGFSKGSAGREEVDSSEIVYSLLHDHMRERERERTRIIKAAEVKWYNGNSENNCPVL